MTSRKEEILNVTEGLIEEMGFEMMSTRDIAERVGISRGTLYHHYASKEEILDVLVERIGERQFAMARQNAADVSVPVLERIVKTVIGLSMDQGGGREILKHLNDPGNLLLHHKIQTQMMETLPPIFAQLVEEGIQEGIFSTPYPLECMEIFVLYVNEVVDAPSLEDEPQQKMKKALALIYNLERMLGTEEGVLLSILQRNMQ
ncbi:MAG: TetR/AcrR family transcriptional regulator [Tissierellia bacterium]|nr:TetR/AcrR family transcriptional regulator [Tissierellia bacterium]